MTPTDGEERGGTFLQVDSLEVYEETSGHRLDLENFCKLFKLGNVAQHEGFFSLDFWWVYDIRAGFEFGVWALRPKVFEKINLQS